MTENTKNRGADDEVETVFPDANVTDAEFGALTKADRARALAIVQHIEHERANKFVEWLLFLPDKVELIVGLGVTGDYPRSVVVKACERAWHFRPSEVVAIVRGLQECQAAWTVATGKAGSREVEYTIKALAYCFKLLVDIDATQLEEMSEDTDVDASGRRYFDGSKNKIRRSS